MNLNGGHVYRGRVRPEEQGESALDWLCRNYRHSDRPSWARRLEEGRLRLERGGATTALEPEQRLDAGDVVLWIRPPWPEPCHPRAYAVLYRDEGLLAVAKPRGLPTLPGGAFQEFSLLFQMQRRGESARPLHRLGRGTSGLVLCAGDRKDRAALHHRFREHQIDKEYRTLVVGRPPEQIEVRTPIGPVPHPRLGQVHAASPDGSPALSHARVLEPRDGHCLLSVRITTGRPHQIRIHLAAAGYPLLGDPLYHAGGQPDPDAVPSDLGYHLHAHRLRLPHPRSGHPLELECLPPPILRRADEGGSFGRQPAPEPALGSETSPSA